MTDSLSTRQGASRHRDARLAAQEFHAAVAQPGMRFVLFYCSPEYDLDVLGPELARLFEGVEVLGCTTAGGEISSLGYLNGTIGGVSVASPEFTVVTHRIDELKQFEFSRGVAAGPALLGRLRSVAPRHDPENCFAFLLVDGMSMKEEPVVSAVYRGLGDIQLFGGSAGDDTRFERTFLFHEGRFREDCAVVALIHTTHPFYLFKTQHFVSNDDLMVVTRADPARRVVTEINAEPAGREYARMVGLDVDKLTPLIFAAHPVVVQLGGLEYVRSIQKVNEDESLTFFCAIDEGIVLTVARGVDLVQNLEQTFAEVRSRVGEPELVLGCDCLLRRLEIEQRGLKAQVSDVLRRNQVIGFATYGEQYNAMHVNQTFTGVAIGARQHGR